MTDARTMMDDRLELVGKIAHALARLKGAVPSNTVQASIAKASYNAVNVALHGLTSNPDGRRESASQINGIAMVADALYDVIEQRPFGAAVHALLDYAYALIFDDRFSAKMQEAMVEEQIAGVDKIVAFYEVQEANRAIMRSDGRDASKLPVVAFGEAMVDVTLSYGEGTLEDPDRCVYSGALFLRDNPVPFGFGPVSL